MSHLLSPRRVNESVPLIFYFIAILWACNGISSLTSHHLTQIDNNDILLKHVMNRTLHHAIYSRVLLWPSSWVQRPTWSAQHSPRRKASTACSALQRWPASTSCSLSQSPAPPAASPKDFSTCPASRICSPPPSRRRRPRAARSCEWRPLGLQSSHATPSPCLFGLGEGGVGTMVLSGLPAESFPHPPRNQTPLRRGGHLAVHLLLNLLAHIHLFPLLFILLSNKQYQSRFNHRAIIFSPVNSMQLQWCYICLILLSLGTCWFCPNWKCATCDV